MKIRHGVAVALLGLAIGGCTGVSRQEEMAGTVAMDCGVLSVTTRISARKLVLAIPGEEIAMTPVAAASGARYEHPEDASTSYWSKGNSARLSIRGQDMPECIAAGTVAEPFRARGNEPFWAMTLENGQFTLERPDTPVNLKAPYRQAGDGADTLVDVQDHDLGLRISRTLCHDNMSGMPYPYGVEFTLEGETLSGCGGEPDRLLRGVTWKVVSLARKPVVENSDLSLSFLEAGRVAGSASCNPYTGHYRLGGEGIAIEKLASTRKACAPEVMAQESAFLAGLASVDRFDFDKQGQLVLFSVGKIVAVAALAGY